VFADPQVQARGMVTHWQHPLQGRFKAGGQPHEARKATPVRTDLPPPLLGQHTDEVLQGVLN
jgi:crotonobetainyl-CoA:carnitine CoA-transferase CaiB-like acyl-CoA transferase